MEPFLVYQQDGYKFSFYNGYVLIYDFGTKREYKMKLSHIHYPEIPFTYTLERQD